MKDKEKFVDVFLGLSLIFWGFAGFKEYYDGLHTPMIRWFTTVLNLTVGILIILRSSGTYKRSYRSMLISLPSVLCGGVLFKLSVSLSIWSTTSQSLFLIGGAITVFSFLFLGKNFSIFPRVRGIVTHGLYRVVRHPAYVGEFLMILGCFLSREFWYSWIPILLFLPAIALRILEEEKMLGRTKEYQEYTKKVKWRLVPFIW